MVWWRCYNRIKNHFNPSPRWTEVDAVIVMCKAALEPALNSIKNIIGTKQYSCLFKWYWS